MFGRAYHHILLLATTYRCARVTLPRPLTTGALGILSLRRNCLSNDSTATVPPQRIPPDLIPDILPSCEVHLLSGASGAGKTALVATLLRACVEEKPFFGLQTRRPAFMGIVSSDRGWRDHAKWFQKVGLEIPYYSLVDDSTVTGHGIRAVHGNRDGLLRSSLKKLIAPIPQDSLIILDPISLFLGGDFLNYDLSYTHMLDMTKEAIAGGFTILATAHASKQKADSGQRYARPQDRVAGTTAQTGCAGTTLHLAPPNETGENWHELSWTPHHAPSGLRRLVREEGTGLFTALSNTFPTKGDNIKMEAARRILAFLPEDGTPVNAKELVRVIMEELGVSRTLVYEWLGIAAALGLVIHAGHGAWRRARRDS